MRIFVGPNKRECMGTGILSFSTILMYVLKLI